MDNRFIRVRNVVKQCLTMLKLFAGTMVTTTLSRRQCAESWFATRCIDRAESIQKRATCMQCVALP